MSASSFREAGAARAGGYVIALASVLIVIGLIFHPLPSGGFEEKPSILQNTPWWDRSTSRSPPGLFSALWAEC